MYKKKKAENKGAYILALIFSLLVGFSFFLFYKNFLSSKFEKIEENTTLNTHTSKINFTKSEVIKYKI